MAEILDVVNENDEVIGQISRDDPNRAGKIYRMVFVGFYTPEKEIILQRRSMLKKSAPGLLTSTVSGHVSSGQTYNQAAVRETYEETGVIIEESSLINQGIHFDGDVMRAVYAYAFNGSLEDLKIEKDEGDGFVAIPVTELQTERVEHPEKFTPFILGEAATKLLDYIQHAP